MPNKKIESIAINAVETFFLPSSMVDTFLAKNDREPAWDGHFYLNSSEDGNKEQLLGRVPAQIKGKTMRKFKEMNFTYPIEMTDLKAYLHEGTYYIVVQEKGVETMIFYRELTPVLVRSIIRAHKGQKSVNVLMFPFPASYTEAENNLRQFMTDCRQQVSFADAEPFDFDDVKKMGVHSFSMSKPASRNNIPLLVSITQKPLYIYANIYDKIKVPIGDGPVTLTMAKEIKAPISVNGTVYYDHYKSTIENGCMSLSIGACLTVRIQPREDGSSDVKFTFEPNIRFLRNAIHDTKFILDVIAYKQIKIADWEWGSLPDVADKSLVDYWREHLTGWLTLRNTLDLLHVREDLDLSLLKKKDETSIDILIAMIMDRKDLSLKEDKTAVLNMNLGKLHLWLLVVKLTNGKCRMFNYFDRSSGLVGSYKYPDGTFRESIYSSLSAKDLLKCSNIYYDDVIPSYQEIVEVNPHAYERANIFGLYLLDASDHLEGSDTRKEDYLNCAESLFLWLKDNDKGGDSELYSINIIQVHKRRNAITEDERILLRNMLNSDNNSGSAKLCAAVLSDDLDSAKDLWTKLDENTRELIMKWPIWYFGQQLLGMSVRRQQ